MPKQKAGKPAAKAPKALTPWQRWTSRPEEALEELCDRIEDGESMTDIAQSLGTQATTLSKWIAADATRPARTREARIKSAATFDGQALKYVLDASDPFSLARAREVAHHLRWRAAKIAPADYGDRQTIDATIKHSADDLLLQLAAERKQA